MSATKRLKAKKQRRLISSGRPCPWCGRSEAWRQMKNLCDECFKRFQILSDEGNKLLRVAFAKEAS